MKDAAIIKIWDQEVGSVMWDRNRGLAIFEYNENFKKQGLELSPFHLPLSLHRNAIVSFPNLRNETFKGLPGLLADSLPDKYGNTLINTWLKTQGRPSDSLTPIEALCFIGKRGMGALEFEPDSYGDYSTFKIDVENLRNIAQQILDERINFSSKITKDDEKSILEILKIGTSAGGARPKALIAYNPDTGEVRSGQTITHKGFSHWILKFDGVSSGTLGNTTGYGRVEMAYYRMAIDCSISMTQCQLLEENGRAHFMTKRFDRFENKKRHMQSFCALRHFDFNDIFSYSYEQLFETIRFMNLPHFSLIELYRRMVFNVVARNCDDHTKNFCFLMDEDGKWRISPAFDVSHAYREGSPWVSQHALSVNGKRSEISKNDLLKVATQYNIYGAEKIINKILEVVGNWPDYANREGVDPQLRDAIYRTLLI